MANVLTGEFIYLIRCLFSKYFNGEKSWWPKGVHPTRTSGVASSSSFSADFYASWHLVVLHYYPIGCIFCCHGMCAMVWDGYVSECSAWMKITSGAWMIIPWFSWNYLGKGLISLGELSLCTCCLKLQCWPDFLMLLFLLCATLLFVHIRWELPYVNNASA